MRDDAGIGDSYHGGRTTTSVGDGSVRFSLEPKSDVARYIPLA